MVNRLNTFGHFSRIQEKPAKSHYHSRAECQNLIVRLKYRKLMFLIEN